MLLYGRTRPRWQGSGQRPEAGIWRFQTNVASLLHKSTHGLENVSGLSVCVSFLRVHGRVSACTPEEQFKRFQETAKEHEIEKRLPEIEKAFDKLSNPL
jgi:hypothetical protein